LEPADRNGEAWEHQPSERFIPLWRNKEKCRRWENHKLPIEPLRSGQDKALAGTLGRPVAALSSWREDLPQQVICACSSEKRDISAILLSPRSFIINPLSLSPRQLEYDCSFPCLDAECKGVSEAFLLQISSIQPRNQESFPMHTLQGCGSCGAVCSEGYWLAAVTTDAICKIHHDFCKGSRSHHSLYMATSQHVV